MDQNSWTRPDVYSFEYRHLDDSIEEYPEYDLKPLNLGAETPNSARSSGFSTPGDLARQAIYEWSHSASGLRPPMSPRNRSWTNREASDTDCGICFEPAVRPARTLCCRRVFCHEHIAEWIHGSSSDGLCPSCQIPCGFRLEPSPSPKPHKYTIRRPSVDELFAQLKEQQSAQPKIYSPSPIKPHVSPSVLYETDVPAPSSGPSTDNPKSTSPPSTTSGTEPVATYNSARQRHASSHLYSQYHLDQVNPSAWVNAGQNFLSPANFIFIIRTLGTILSLLGMLLVFFVLSS